MITLPHREGIISVSGAPEGYSPWLKWVGKLDMVIEVKFGSRYREGSGGLNVNLLIFSFVRSRMSKLHEVRHLGCMSRISKTGGLTIEFRRRIVSRCAFNMYIWLAHWLAFLIYNNTNDLRKMAKKRSASRRWPIPDLKNSGPGINTYRAGMPW